MLPNSWSCSHIREDFFPKIWNERLFVRYAEENHRERNPFCQ